VASINLRSVSLRKGRYSEKQNLINLNRFFFKSSSQHFNCFNTNFQKFVQSKNCSCCTSLSQTCFFSETEMKKNKAHAVPKPPPETYQQPPVSSCDAYKASPVSIVTGVQLCSFFSVGPPSAAPNYVTIVSERSRKRQRQRHRTCDAGELRWKLRNVLVGRFTVRPAHHFTFHGCQDFKAINNSRIC